MEQQSCYRTLGYSTQGLGGCVGIRGDSSEKEQPVTLVMENCGCAMYADALFSGRKGGLSFRAGGVEV